MVIDLYAPPKVPTIKESHNVFSNQYPNIFDCSRTYFDQRILYLV